MTTGDYLYVDSLTKKLMNNSAENNLSETFTEVGKGNVGRGLFENKLELFQY